MQHAINTHSSLVWFLVFDCGIIISETEVSLTRMVSLIIVSIWLVTGLIWELSLLDMLFESASGAD